ncbi:hypothetical protein [Kitasatospora sp. NPDC051705]|uniref:hypothetical protein n=1 Tax=Kitasatospora sp. NPDC051705 TaxID=3364057 RepID=UPI0037A73CC8
MGREASGRWSAFQRLCAAGVVAAVAVLGVAAAPVVWAESQDAPGDRRGWLVVCGVALLAGVAASVPLGRRVTAADYAASVVGVVLLLAVALGTVFAAAQATHAVGLRLHEPRAVAATVTDCRTTGRELDDQGQGHDVYGCTYHWSVDDRESSERRPTHELLPDGHRTRVWVDGDRMITEKPGLLAIPFWVVLTLAGLLGTLAFAANLAARVRDLGLLSPP